jgi:hypothetical protein
MLAELMTKLEAMALKTVKPFTFHAEGEPDDVYYLVDKDGHAERVTADPEPRTYTAGSVAALCHVVADWVAAKTQPCVWFSREKVCATMNEESRREWIEYSLNTTKQFQVVSALSGAEKWKDQKSFLRLLRIDLHDCGIDPGAIAIFRNLRFSASQGGTGVIEMGKRSLTSDMKANLESAGGVVPEVLTLSVQVFEEPDFRCNVNCSVEQEPEKCMLALLPLPGEVENAVRMAEKQIGEMIATRLTARLVAKQLESPPVYYGKPNA